MSEVVRRFWISFCWNISQVKSNHSWPFDCKLYEVIKNGAIHSHVVKIFYQNSESFAATVRKLLSIWGFHNGPSEATVWKLFKKFSESASYINVKRLTCVRPGCQTNISQLFVIVSLKVQPLQFDTDHRKCLLSWNVHQFFLPKLVDIDV